MLEVYLEKGRQLLEVFKSTGSFHHMLGTVFAMIANISPDAWRRRPGTAHILSPTEVEGLADLAHFPHPDDTVDFQSVRQILART